MSIKFVIPAIYFYHTKNISETNPTGYIGGIDGANVEEFKAVLDDLRRMYYNGLEEEATQRS
jgi:hypothetical protein